MSIQPAEKFTDLESLRITRAHRSMNATRTRVVFSVILVLALAVAGVAASKVYSRTIGRPPQVQTLIVQPALVDQPRILLTGSGYVVTRHKYITIGTKILGQIIAEPIEEGQRV